MGEICFAKFVSLSPRLLTSLCSLRVGSQILVQQMPECPSASLGHSISWLVLPPSSGTSRSSQFSKMKATLSSSFLTS